MLAYFLQICASSNRLFAEFNLKSPDYSSLFEADTWLGECSRAFYKHVPAVYMLFAEFNLNSPDYSSLFEADTRLGGRWHAFLQIRASS